MGYQEAVQNGYRWAKTCKGCRSLMCEIVGDVSKGTLRSIYTCEKHKTIVSLDHICDSYKELTAYTPVAYDWSRLGLLLMSDKYRF